MSDDVREAGIENRFLLFRSLRQFLDANKVLTDSGIDQERLTGEFLPTIESAAEDVAVEYLNGLSVSASQRLFAHAGFNPQAIPLLLAADWDIYEGTEDPEIVSSELIDKDMAYVLYNFNLRMVTVQWTVRAADYLQHKSFFETAFWNAKGDDEFIHLETVVRCYFKSSFIVDVARGEVVESSIDSSWLRDFS